MSTDFKRPGSSSPEIIVEEDLARDSTLEKVHIALESIRDADDNAVVTAKFTGAAAILATTAKIAPKLSSQFRFLGVSCKFSAAPATSESLVVTLDSRFGSDYDVILYTVDPSVGAVTSIVKSFDNDDIFTYDSGDEITVAYTNTDTRTYGLQLKYKQL